MLSALWSWTLNTFDLLLDATYVVTQGKGYAWAVSGSKSKF